MWTKVTKPTSSVWSNVNAQGKEQYDQPTLTYNDANTFYDGINTNQWTDIAKPTGASAFNVGVGNATGLIMSPTYPYARSGSASRWIKVSKPT